MKKLDPFSQKKREILSKLETDRHAARAKLIKEKRNKAGRAKKHTRTKLNTERCDGLTKSYRDAEDLIAEEIRLGAYQPGDTEEEDDE